MSESCCRLVEQTPDGNGEFELVRLRRMCERGGKEAGSHNLAELLKFQMPAG
jgi:hypothetical protein